MKRSLTGGIAAAALAATMIAPPAHAEYYSVVDPPDATASLTDVLNVRVRHGADEVNVVVSFADLRRSSAAAASVFFDTVKSRRGPEYVLTSGLGDGTDYVLREAVRWRGRGEPVDCDYRARPKWARDTFRTVLSRACFGDPEEIEEIRASVKMGDLTDGSHPVIDWAPGRRQWSSWLGRGA